MAYQVVQGHKKGKTGRLAGALAKGFGGYREQQLMNDAKEEERRKLEMEISGRDRTANKQLFASLYPHMTKKAKKWSPEQYKAFVSDDAERIRENADVWVGKLMKRVENDDGTSSYVKMSKQEIMQLPAEQLLALTGSNWQKQRMLDMAGTSHLNKGVEGAKRGYMEVRIPQIDKAVIGLEGSMGALEVNPEEQIAAAMSIRESILNDIKKLKHENSANMYVALMKKEDMQDIRKEYQGALNRTNAVLRELGVGNQAEVKPTDGVKGAARQSGVGTAGVAVPGEQPEFEVVDGGSPFVMKGSPADKARAEGLQGVAPPSKPGLLERFIGAAQKHVPFDDKYADGWKPPVQAQPQPQAQSADDILGTQAEMRQAQRTSEGAGMGVTEMIQGAGQRHGIDPVLIQSVIEQESDFNEGATGKVGEIGLMQLKPEAGALLQYNKDKRAGEPPITPEQAYDPVVNIEIGAWYLRWVKEHLGPEATTPQILKVYNGGSGNYDKGVVSPQAAKYAISVMGRAKGFGGIGGP